MPKFPQQNRIELIDKILPSLARSYEHCDLCVHRCGVNRLACEKGSCSSSAEAKIYTYNPHHGEEPPLSGTKGSGTIFFSRCNMSCIYCQNWRFSQNDNGKEVTAEELARIMIELQGAGCHNINFVSPTHFVPSIVEAIRHATINGLKIPILYNTGGYDSLHIIKMLEGIVDIYLPDMRYSKDNAALKYSNATAYTLNNRLIVKEMARQVGKLKLSPAGIALSGILIRLLILPNGISGTVETLDFIARELGYDTYLSVMSQYYPAYKADRYSELARRINSDEYALVIKKLEELSLSNGWIQPFDGDFDPRFAGENFLPSR